MSPAIFELLAPFARQQRGSTRSVPTFNMPNVAPPDYSGATAQEDEAIGLLNRLMQAQAPKPVTPAFRTEDAIKGILGLLLGGGRNPEEFITGYLGGKQNLANEDTQRQNQEFAQRQQFLAQQAQNLQRQAGLTRDEEDARYNRDYRQAHDTATRNYDRDMAIFNEGSRLIRDLDSVKSEAGLLGIQEAARQLGVPLDPRSVAAVKTVIQDEKDQSNLLKQQQADDRRLSIQRNAASNWDARLNQFRDDYGILKPEAYAQLLRERDSFAKQFGIYDPNVLQMPYSDVTMAREKLSKYGEDLAKKWATAKVRLDYERQRLDQAERRLELGQNQFAALERNRAERNYMSRVREYNKIARDIAGTGKGDSNTKKLSDIDQKIAGLRAKQSATKDPDQRNKIELSIVELAGVRQFIRDSMIDDGSIEPFQVPLGGELRTGGLDPSAVPLNSKAKQRLDALRKKGVQFEIEK